MIDDSNQKPGLTLEQEEALLRERLEKIILFKRLAKELGQPLDGVLVTPHHSSAPAPRSFDGTIAGLVRAYRSDPGSPYFKLKTKVRNNYDGALNRIVADIGHET